jgi:MFS family permease
MNTLRHPAFRRLFIGDVISLFGGWLSYVAVALLALSEGDGLLALASIFIIHTLPHALLAPLAGGIADRFDRRIVVLVANILMGLVTILMAVFAISSNLLAVQIMLALRVTISVVVEPAQSAILARVVPKEELEAANTLHATAWGVMFALGTGVSGILTSLTGPEIALALDAVTFFVAALILRGLPSVRPERGAPPLRQALAGLKAAAELTRNTPGLTAAVLAKVPTALAGGAAWVLLNDVSTRVAGLGAAGMALGILQASRAVGTGIGPLLLSRVQRRVGEEGAWWASAGLAFAGIAVFTAAEDGLGLSAVWLLVGALAWGVGVGAQWVQSATRRQARTPDSAQGRLAALDTLLYSIAASAGAFFGALGAESLGVSAVAGWFGLIAGVVLWLVIVRPSIRTPLVV